MGIFNLFKSGNNNEKIIIDYLQNGAVIIDVRTPGEFADGHIEGSINICLDRITQNIDKIKKYDKAVIAVCRSGARSGNATNFLKQQGIDIINGGPWNIVEQYIVKQV